MFYFMANHLRFGFTAMPLNENGIDKGIIEFVKKNNTPVIVYASKDLKGNEVITSVEAYVETRKGYALEGKIWMDDESMEGLSAFFRDVQTTESFHDECNGGETFYSLYQDGELVAEWKRANLFMEDIHSERVYEPTGFLHTHIWEQEEKQSNG